MKNKIESKIINDKVKLIELKRQHKGKITYEEFALLLSINEELDFEYNNILYGIIHNPPKVFIGINVVYNEDKCTTERFEEYSNVEEMLNNFEINGKTIKDIWENVEF